MSAAEEILRGIGLGEPAAQLRAYVEKQRWFGGRERGLDRLEVEDAGVLDGEPTLVSVMLRAHYAGGESDRYHVPLAVRPPGDAVDGLIAEGERDGGAVVVSDGLLDAGAAWRFWQLLRGTTLGTAAGELVGVAPGYALGDDPEGVHVLSRDQSNTMLVRGERELLKCFRRFEAQSSPEIEMLTALKAAGFTNTPAPMGVIEYRGRDHEPVVLAMLQPYLHNATDGWALAMTSLRDLYAEAEESDLEDDGAIRDMVDEQGSDFTPDAERLGTVIGSMHLALGSDRLPDPMRAVEVGPAELAQWTDEMLQDLDTLAGGQAAARVPIDAVRGRIEALREQVDGGRAIRVHGDLHLGQTARTDSGWMVLDFEGEPARSVEARQRKASPLRDVAGMLRSFDYAAAVALLDRTDPEDPQWPKLQRFGDAWAAVNREAFWDAYIAVVGDSGLLPPATLVPRMLDAYLVQKAIYEVAYELAHRPDWAAIPLRFLEGMA